MAVPRPPDAQAPREAALGRGVAQLMAVAERYPDLKANDEFLSLQRELVDTEDRIQVAPASTTPTCARTTRWYRASRR